MITLRNLVVPTRTVWQVILFRETGVVQRITYSFNYFFLPVVLFTQFIVDKMKKRRSVSSYTTKSYFIKITQSLVLPHATLVRV